MNFEAVKFEDGLYLKIPKFYYKIQSNDINIVFGHREGYKLHRAFINNNEVIECFYVPLYTASIKNDSIVYEAGRVPASISDMKSIGITKASDIIDYCRDNGSHLMTIFESGAIQLLELYNHQRGTKYIEPKNWSTTLPLTGSYEPNTIGLYDTSGILWNYVMGLTRPVDVDTGYDFYYFKDSIDVTELRSKDVFLNLNDIHTTYNRISLHQIPNICKYVEYRGPTDCFRTDDICTDMFIFNENTDFYETVSSLTTDGIFCYHRKGLFPKVFACFNTTKGKGTCTIDLFSHNNDVWYNSGFRGVRY